MEIQLRDPETFPSKEVLQNTLGDSFSAFDMLMATIADRHELVAEWNYYRDGKAWLCKVVHKKKTVFWLSVWEGSFKTGFYFTEKSRPGIDGLEINNSLKEAFMHAKPIGKLIPLIVHVFGREQIPDVLRIIEYKKSLK